MSLESQTGAADGCDQSGASGVVAQLAADPAKVHVDGLRRGPVLGVPDLAHQLSAGHDLTGSDHQAVQQIELLSRQQYLDAATPDSAANGIEPHVLHLKHPHKVEAAGHPAHPMARLCGRQTATVQARAGTVGGTPELWVSASRTPVASRDWAWPCAARCRECSDLRASGCPLTYPTADTASRPSSMCTHTPHRIDVRLTSPPGKGPRFLLQTNLEVAVVVDFSV